MSRAETIRIERRREIRAPVERVWSWMCDARGLQLFRVNVFHAAAASDEPALRVGGQIRIEHRLLLAREKRLARITELRPYALAWVETLGERRDWFPHAQRFELHAGEGARCTLRNTLSGTFRLLGARWWLLPWYRQLLPRILDLENRRIARATEREQLPR